MSNKEKYTQYCKTSSVPIYLHPEWLEMVSKSIGDWDVVFSYQSDGAVRAYWPFVTKKQFFWNKLTMPSFTPYMGPRLMYPEGLNEYERISFENEVVEDLLSQLPNLEDIRFKWEKAYTNWLPFYWNGFQQETRYTYCISKSANLDTIRSNYKKSVHRQIQKASKSLTIQEASQPESVIQMFALSMQNQQQKVDTDLLKKLDLIAHNHQCKYILEALNTQGQCIAAIYLLICPDEIMYLYGGYNRQYQDSGAMHLLFDHAIAEASKRSLNFNFEGSMLQGVERFFRSFGGNLTPVSFIKKSKFPFSYVR